MTSAPSEPHARTTEHCLDALRTSVDGLSSDQARRRLAEHGPNRLPVAPPRPLLIRFLRHFHNVLMYVLIGGAVVTAMLGHMIDTWVILAVVLVNAVVGFVQEGRAENAMAAIRQMLAPHASVMRGGHRRSVEASDLVPGDVVYRRTG